MPAVFLRPLDPHRHSSLGGDVHPLPELLQTPSGLAILELQGTINMPTPDVDVNGVNISVANATPVGRLVFPDYSSAEPVDDKAWMKRVHLYVGKHQRLTGEVKRLPAPMALIRRKDGGSRDNTSETEEELEIVEVIRWKILFSQRPEPVGS